MLVCYRRSYYIRVYIYIYRHNSLFSYITIFHTVIKTAYYSNDSIGAKLTFWEKRRGGRGVRTVRGRRKFESGVESLSFQPEAL